MAEYIDRDAVYTAFANACTDVLERASEIIYIAGFSYERVIEILDDIPTVNVAPVVHGRWIHTDLASHWYGKDECSECTYHEQDRSDLSHFRYCPNCGAKMDGGDSDDKR